MERTFHVLFTDRDELFQISDTELSVFANELLEYIINTYQDQLIQEILYTSYSFISENEQTFVFEGVYNNLCEKQIEKYVFDPLYNYLKKHDQINIDGFVRFRLQGYIDLLEDAVEQAVNGYIVEVEYNQLILYLTKYIELQQPMVSAVYITAQQGSYKILDEEFCEIASLKNFEDTMLDILITLAPEKIYLYNVHEFENKQLLKTIRKIFRKRLYALENDIPIPTNLKKSENPFQFTF